RRARRASTTTNHNEYGGGILGTGGAGVRSLKRAPPRLNLVREMLADICRDLGRAAEAIGRMRSLVANTSYELRQVDLNEVVRTVREILSPQAIEMGIILSTDQEGCALPVRADPIQLQQAVLNLAVNGMDAMVKSMPGQRRMVLQTAMVGTCTAEVSVSDSGSGFPVDRLERVFEPFFTTKQTGT